MFDYQMVYHHFILFPLLSPDWSHETTTFLWFYHFDEKNDPYIFTSSMRSSGDFSHDTTILLGQFPLLDVQIDKSLPLMVKAPYFFAPNLCSVYFTMIHHSKIQGLLVESCEKSQVLLDKHTLYSLRWLGNSVRSSVAGSPLLIGDIFWEDGCPKRSFYRSLHSPLDSGWS